MATIRDLMTTINVKNPKKIIMSYKTNNPQKEQDESEMEKESDSS